MHTQTTDWQLCQANLHLDDISIVVANQSALEQLIGQLWRAGLRWDNRLAVVVNRSSPEQPGNSTVISANSSLPLGYFCELLSLHFFEVFFPVYKVLLVVLQQPVASRCFWFAASC